MPQPSAFGCDPCSISPHLLWFFDYWAGWRCAVGFLIDVGMVAALCRSKRTVELFTGLAPQGSDRKGPLKLPVPDGLHLIIGLTVQRHSHNPMS